MVGSKKRELPADFVEVANSLNWGWVALRKHYSIADATLKRLFSRPEVAAAKAAFTGRIAYREPVPADLAELAKTMTIKQLCAHYGICNKKLMRWRKATGVKPIVEPTVIGATPLRPVPDDFAQVAPTMLFYETMRHYNCGDAVLRRWLEHTGIQCKRRMAKPKVRKRAAPGNVRPFNGYIGPRRADVSSLNKPRSFYDEAADVLRRYGPCHRCRENGVYAEFGDYWRYGNTVMTGEELLAKAERYRAKAA